MPERNVAVDEHGIPDKCPECGSDDLCIDNELGMECMNCDCWFDTDSVGLVLWAYERKPMTLF